MEDKKNNTSQNTAFAAGSGGQNDKSTNANTASANLSSAKDSTVETVKDTANDVLDKAKDSAGKVYGLATEKAASTIEEQKTNLAGGLSGVADSIRQVGKNLRDGDEQNAITDLTAKYGETIAGQIEKVSGYFDKKELKDIVRDVEHFARKQPAIFIGAAFAAGLLAARFLKSGSGEIIPQELKNLTGEQPGSDKQKTNNQDKQIGQTAVNAS
jgi:ElaB/YqjD/DUF883 family membrane-anchored ribosome-binding protein